jgi:cytochrome P450
MGDHAPEWDPLAADVLVDQRAAYDAMRETRPVAYSDVLHWSVFRHEDVVRVLRDHESFSNAVSAHLSAPNGMDPPEHTGYRRVIEPFFSAERMEAFEPICRTIVGELLDKALARREVEVMDEIGRQFAVRVQCAFLGWPAEVERQLTAWLLRTRTATRAQDRAAHSDLARQFERIIDEQLDSRRQALRSPASDVTAQLMSQRIWDRPLSNEEIASIVRNWTAGEVGTIAASIGILVHFLVSHGELQNELRADPALLTEAIDEILRIDGPLVFNRRVVRRPVELGGRSIAAGERLSIMWIAANRDGRVFENPYEFRWDRDGSKNLLYGDGIHACPGAPLARLEMRVFMEELLARTAEVQLAPDRPAPRAHFPAGGYEELHVRLS